MGGIILEHKLGYILWMCLSLKTAVSLFKNLISIFIAGIISIESIVNIQNDMSFTLYFLDFRMVDPGPKECCLFSSSFQPRRSGGRVLRHRQPRAWLARPWNQYSRAEFSVARHKQWSVSTSHVTSRCSLFGQLLVVWT